MPPTPVNAISRSGWRSRCRPRKQGVWDYNLVTGEMVYDERAKQIYGLPVDQPVTFETVRDATHPEDCRTRTPRL